MSGLAILAVGFGLGLVAGIAMGPLYTWTARSVSMLFARHKAGRETHSGSVYVLVAEVLPHVAAALAIAVLMVTTTTALAPIVDSWSGFVAAWIAGFVAVGLYHAFRDATRR